MREPADHVLFFTDGVVEGPLGRRELRASEAATPAAETMRRLVHAILDHQ